MPVDLTTYLKQQKSPLAAYVPALVQSGKKWGVDPRAIVAISGGEESFGRAATPEDLAHHNIWGIGPGHSLGATWEQGIDAAAKLLATGYKKLGTFQRIGTKWAPSGAANDPTGLNNAWARNVGRFYQQLGGDPTKSIFTGSSGSNQYLGQPVAAGGGPGLGPGLRSVGGVNDLLASPALHIPPSFMKWVQQSEKDVMKGIITPLPKALDIGSFFHALPQVSAGGGAGGPTVGVAQPTTYAQDLTTAATVAQDSYRTPWGTTFQLPATPQGMKRPEPTTTAQTPKGQDVPLYRYDGELVNTWWVPILNFARAHGWKGQVNSGYRTVEQQRGLAASQPNRTLVARPGSSPHNFGMAIDIGDPVTFQRIIQQYKLPVWRYAAETWHFEPAGFRTNGTETGRNGKFGGAQYGH